MSPINIGIIFLLVVIVIIIIVISIIATIRIRRRKKETPKHTPLPTIKPEYTPVFKACPGQRCNSTEECEQGCFSLHGISSKLPISELAKTGSNYLKTSVSTTNHPFLLNKNGMFMDEGNQWSLAGSKSCSEDIGGGRFHLTETGIYFLTNLAAGADVLLKIDEGHFGSGEKIVDIHKLFIYNNYLYAFSGRRLYVGFNMDQFRHVYLRTTWSAHSYHEPGIEYRRQWTWSIVNHIAGKDITNIHIYDVDVGLGINPSLFGADWKPKKKEETLSISTNDGECHIYKNNTWRTVAIDPYRTGVVGAATVTGAHNVPNRIRLGYDDQEIWFYGRTVAFTKYFDGAYNELYRVENVYDAIVDVKCRRDGLWVLTKSLELVHYMYNGTLVKKPRNTSGVRLERAGDEAWITCTGETHLI